MELTIFFIAKGISMKRVGIILLVCHFLVACGGGSSADADSGKTPTDLATAQVRDCENALTVGGDFCPNRTSANQFLPGSPTGATAVAATTAANL